MSMIALWVILILLEVFTILVELTLLYPVRTPHLLQLLVFDQH